MSKLVVFGANGFIGKPLVRALAQDASNNIIAFGRFANLQAGTEHPFTELSNVKVVAGNFFNRDEVSSVLEGADSVFHLISSTNPAATDKNPFVDIDTNVRTSLTLFELCVEHGVKKVIFPSSGGTVYGDINSRTLSEDTLPQPRSPYGIGKLTTEHFLRYFNSTSGLDYICYRIANPYGPGQNIYGKQGVIPIFMHKLLNNEPLTIYGDGSMVRDYVYIDDLIQMIASSYAKPHKYYEYNLGSGHGTSVADIVGSIETCVGRSVEKQHFETPPTFVHSSVLDTSRFENEFGKVPLTSLDKGIERTWEYVKKLG